MYKSGYTMTNHNALGSDEIRSVETRSGEVMLDLWSEYGFTEQVCEENWRKIAD